MSVEIKELTIKTELVYGRNSAASDDREMEKRLERLILKTLEKYRRTVTEAVLER